MKWFQTRGGEIYIECKKKVFYNKGSEALEHVDKRGGGCPIPGRIQCQAGLVSGQPGLVVGDPARSRGLELDEHCGPFQPRPFCGSMKNKQARKGKMH